VGGVLLLNSTNWAGIVIVLWTQIQKVLGSNFSWDTAYPAFYGFPQYLEANTKITLYILVVP
jgi:hypothetical protein